MSQSGSKAIFINFQQKQQKSRQLEVVQGKLISERLFCLFNHLKLMHPAHCLALQHVFQDIDLFPHCQQNMHKIKVQVFLDRWDKSLQSQMQSQKMLFNQRKNNCEQIKQEKDRDQCISQLKMDFRLLYCKQIVFEQLSMYCRDKNSSDGLIQKKLKEVDGETFWSEFMHNDTFEESD